jgi:hypothetical protein
MPFAGGLAGTGLHATASSAGVSMGLDTAVAEPAASEAGLPVLAGSQVLRSNTVKHGNISWVATSCLVPEGLPTAAAAEADGGLACMEVVCRVLVLQECRAAAASPGLVKALSKGMHMSSRGTQAHLSSSLPCCCTMLPCLLMLLPFLGLHLLRVFMPPSCSRATAHGIQPT